MLPNLGITIFHVRVFGQTVSSYSIDLSGTSFPNPDLYGFHAGKAMSVYDVRDSSLIDGDGLDLQSDDPLYKWYEELEPGLLRFPVGSQANISHLMHYDEGIDAWAPSMGYGYCSAQIARLYDLFELTSGVTCKDLKKLLIQRMSGLHI